MADMMPTCPRKARGAKVETFRGRGGHYWRIKAANGRIVAIGGEGYTRSVDAIRAFHRAGVHFNTARLNQLLAPR